MRRVFLLFAVLFVVPLLGSDSPKEYDDGAEMDAFQGSWKVVRVTLNDEALRSTGTVLTFHGGGFAWKEGGGMMTGSYKIDATRRPAHIDTTVTNGPEKGAVMKLIGQLDGDMLKLASGLNSAERPKSFDDGSVIMTLKRVKK